MSVKIYFLDVNKTDEHFLYNSSFLYDEDREYLTKFKERNAYLEHLASLYLKRRYIGEYNVTNRGKPVSDKYEFNISHSHGMVALAICQDKAVGIDIEKIRPVDDNLIKYISSEKEYEYISNNEKFVEIWTNKESLLKAVGSGIESKVDEVPGLPLNGMRLYKNKEYRSKTFKYEKFVISITLEGKEDFKIYLMEEEDCDKEKK
mgnify:FL=1